MCISPGIQLVACCAASTSARSFSAVPTWRCASTNAGLLRGAFRAPYARGVPTTDFKQTGRTQSGERHGTKTTFHPDPESFKNVLEFSFEQPTTVPSGEPAT